MKHTLTLLTALLLAPLAASVRAGEAKPITGMFVDVSRIRHDAKSWGDTWDHIWADDDNLYTFGCDGGGYGASNNNLNFNKLTGPAWDQLVGSPVNPMSEYGKNGSYLADNSTQLMDRDWKKPMIPRGPNWKVTGADCIDGVFYAFVAENWYGNQNAFGGNALDPFLRQTVNNMSLIKSTDKGLTWTRAMAANAEKPMWTDKRFSTAFFFKYGQNGGNTRQDEQDKFVYAISNDGYWNCGSAFYLGRVPRAKIGNLNAADWQYSCDGKWTGKLSAATPVPGLPNGQNKCTMGSPVWLSSLKRYVTVTWFDPCTTTRWHYPDDVTFAFYQAEHPWGPWSYIGAKSAMEFIGKPGQTRVSRWYGPTLSPKFITDNPDGSVTVILLFSGQTWENKPDSLYKNNSCPVTFYSRPLPKLRETVNDTAAKFSDGWRYEPKRGVGAYQDDVHATVKTGSYCDFEFTGEGIEILSEKFHNMGEVEVLLDGQSQGRFNLYQDPMPRLYQIPFYRRMDLAKGRHTVRVINRAPDGVTCLVDGFKVYGAPGFVTGAGLAAPAGGPGAEPVAEGPFKPDMESFKQYRCPEWFRDAKFGIWAHWGPQCVPGVDGWYAHNMYVEGSSAYKFHLTRYGHPSKFGYKDIIPLWKAEKFDPDALMALYKKAGARYFVSMGVHHDNFDLWDSPKLHKWNSVNMGPKKDIVALWQAAAKKQGLRFGVSEHLGFGFTYLQSSHGADTNGPLAGVPYDGNDPRYEDLYFWKADSEKDPLPSSPKMGWTKDQRFHALWFARIKDLIDRHQPDLLYSDARHLMFQETGMRLLAHYYNSNILKNGGKLDAVYNLKMDKPGWVYDMERGLQTEIRAEPWQTDTSNSDWFYNPGSWRGYKKPGEVIQLLCDVVSKNGNLLLNVVQYPDGSLPPESKQLLDELTAWMPVNGEAIFETRPWKTYGERPAVAGSNVKSDLFNEDKLKLSAADIRFTQSKDGKTLYAIVLGVPKDAVRITSLGADSTLLEKKIATISLLGSDAKLDWKQEADALVIQPVAKWSCQHAVVFRIAMGEK